MSKILALFMCLSVFTVQADSGLHGSLKAAFDELNYSLTVEWDQHDKNFYQQQMNVFQKNIQELRKQGLSNQELVDYLISNVQDKAAAQDLKVFYEMASSGELSSVEVENMARDLMNRHYAQGASWIGTVLLVGGILIVLIVGITAIVLWDASNNPDNCKYDYVCNDDGTCSYTNYHCD